MDRFTYKGPVWEENGGPPKTSMEEVDPIYPKIEKEERPDKQENSEETWGEKKFEYVVR